MIHIFVIRETSPCGNAYVEHYRQEEVPDGMSLFEACRAIGCDEQAEFWLHNDTPSSWIERVYLDGDWRTGEYGFCYDPLTETLLRRKQAEIRLQSLYAEGYPFANHAAREAALHSDTRATV